MPPFGNNSSFQEASYSGLLSTVFEKKLTTKILENFVENKTAFYPPNVHIQVVEQLLLDAIDSYCLYFVIKHVIRVIVLCKK